MLYIWKSGGTIFLLLGHEISKNKLSHFFSSKFPTIILLETGAVINPTLSYKITTSVFETAVVQSLWMAFYVRQNFNKLFHRKENPRGDKAGMFFFFF